MIGQSGKLVAEYIEVETGKSKDRPELLKAIAHAKRSKSTLVVAKLEWSDICLSSQKHRRAHEANFRSESTLLALNLPCRFTNRRDTICRERH